MEVLLFQMVGIVFLPHVTRILSPVHGFLELEKSDFAEVQVQFDHLEVS